MLLRLIVSIIFLPIALAINTIHLLDPKDTNVDASECQQQSTAQAIWLPETGIMQDLGKGQSPDHIQSQLVETICEMNAYYRTIVRKDECQLAAPRCQNRQPLCAFWVLQGQCTNTNYRKYMETNCPVACRLCHTELFRARAWLDLLQELHRVYSTDEASVDVVTRRQRVLEELMSHLGMSTNQSNYFAEELVRRIHAVIPRFLAKLYSTKEPLTEQEMSLMCQLHGLDPNLPADQVKLAVLVQYRERGHIVAWMELTDALIVRPIQLSVAFAIPNEEALQTIRDLHIPILEMGAGSGYWTAHLQSMGISVVAYDAARGAGNAFFNVWYTDDIQQGNCEQVMQAQPELAPTHALLLIWPNDPDPIDHPQFCHGDVCDDSEPVWDAACLQAYMKNGGSTVIFVGERQRMLQERYGTNESGMSATLQFQRLLEDSFDLQKVVSIPQLWLNDDDMTVWTRKVGTDEL
ncbi:hypothetical protein FisN_UnNu079 [Fistulifera solaris]|uniref:ShKT domain-containing protein n=1 Tax=Fistulifera solaris TaxID=1519565 RepID=A0A1Z5JQ84_FISSO|nr:hypothetical protein FisN_UnNu079 [Fistulifera solaris]|eukprot:GAX15928.1 hypothetical protein FisN_UnNu079 [Fistulifera solaris]